MAAFFIPSINLMGAGCLVDAADNIKAQGFKKGLIVTDSILSISVSLVRFKTY
ncbi:alcohol dehydrogenase [Vibrio sp. JCM 19236]|nr:alcohol dehydrogenase [Vibrio sp. JCM 19236]